MAKYVVVMEGDPPPNPESVPAELIRTNYPESWASFVSAWNAFNARKWSTGPCALREPELISDCPHPVEFAERMLWADEWPHMDARAKYEHLSEMASYLATDPTTHSPWCPAMSRLLCGHDLRCRRALGDLLRTPDGPLVLARDDRAVEARGSFSAGALIEFAKARGIATRGIRYGIGHPAGAWLLDSSLMPATIDLTCRDHGPRTFDAATIRASHAARRSTCFGREPPQ